MCLYDRVKLLCDEHGMSVRQLSISCGFAPSAIGKWKQHDPSYDKIQIVANFFDVTTDWLTGKSDVRKNEQTIYYTDGETAIIAQELSEDQRALMDAIPYLPASKVKALRAIVDEMKGTNTDG